MRKVRILLSGKTYLPYYTEALQQLGAEADASYLPAVDTDYDGLILCGGNDVDPSRYGEPINGAVDIDYVRDEAEWALLKAYVDAGKPVLGICRGFQLINVFFGGSLHQHIPETDLHRDSTGFDRAHPVTALENSLLGAVYGSSFAVNSVHHQAIKRLGDGLRGTAFWNDTYVEAFEHTSAPIFGVQWHPERMCFQQKRTDTVDGAAVFEIFINLCKR